MKTKIDAFNQNINQHDQEFDKLTNLYLNDSRYKQNGLKSQQSNNHPLMTTFKNILSKKGKTETINITNTNPMSMDMMPTNYKFKY